jgi:nucleoside-diphosphate-sugar epimerase
MERGYEVHAVGYRRVPDAGTEGIVWHTADLLDPRERAQIVDAVEPRYLLQAAWYLEPGKTLTSPVNLDWVIASLDLVRRFQQRGGRRVVTLGTCFEYAFGPAELSETSPLLPASVYGASKVALHTAQAALAKATGTSSAWARLFYLYGPNEDARRLVGDIVSSLLAGREVATAEGLHRRDYMYVADAGRAIAALLDSTVEGPVNIATGRALVVRDLVDLVARTIGREELVRYGSRPLPPGEPDEIRANVQRLRDEVRWADLTPHDEAVGLTVDWWRSRTEPAQV